MFSCAVDRENLAEQCCLCTFPLLPLCPNCYDAHCSKPGLHYLLPLEFRERITSDRDRTRLENRVHQLQLTHKELKRVTDTFQLAREEIEATYREVVELMTDTKARYIAEMMQAEEDYSKRMEEGMQELYLNAWRGKEWVPEKQFEAEIWSHVSGEDAEFVLTYKVEAEKSLAVWLFKVKWQLPFPDFTPPEEKPTRPALPTLPGFPTALPDFRKSTSVDSSLLPPDPQTYPIFVKTLTGKTIPLNTKH